MMLSDFESEESFDESDQFGVSMNKEVFMITKSIFKFLTLIL